MNLAMCRCPDQPGEHSAKREACQPLIVIEGPHEPTTMRHVLQPTIDFLSKHDPGGAILSLCLP